MKNVLFVGDTHGLDVIDTIKEGLKNFYDIVCCGDYVDSFFVPAREQLYNLNNLCVIARENKDRITLLLGNHDYSYLYGLSDISGYQYLKAHEYKKYFKIIKIYLKLLGAIEMKRKNTHLQRTQV